VQERCSGLLDPRERAQAAQRHGDAIRRYVVAHGALRTILAAHTGVAPDVLRYAYRCAVCGSTEHGRPELDPAQRRDAVSFSLSHSHEVAVVAVMTDATGPVGVDVEVARSRPYLERIATRVLAPPAVEEWRALPPDERVRAFLRAWTAKEAYLKQLGVGLTRRLVDVPAGDAQTWDDWPPGCVTSVVATERGPFTTRRWVP
jgi:4'-phosphopantetheinyl transferase